MKQIIECVPNFSEGRDMGIIRQITDVIEAVEGVNLLDVDPGKATNRTVVTFVGEPEMVVKAAFQAIAKAKELIDMSRHQGEHPRFGATDVCPLVPVSNISMEETISWARKLAERVGKELDYPVYCYESAALSEQRKNLAEVRAGEYEGLPDKLKLPEWEPDFGPPTFRPRTGAIAIGARDFLVAFNVNLNTTSTRRANAVAFDVRERGRVKRKGHPLTGEIIRDEKGNPVYMPGSLKSVKAIGWYIKEYGIAQISMNLTNITITSVHEAFDEVCRRAENRGLRVTGSELVGLIPLKAMLDAGRYFLRKQQRSLGVADSELIKIAVKSMGLDELTPFDPKQKIIEYKVSDASAAALAALNVREFMEETASESPAPGGGSVAALMGALGTALGTMVANLSAHKRGWDERWEEFSEWAEKGKDIQENLLGLMDEDTLAFNAIMDAFGMPKGTKKEEATRKAAIQSATKAAILVPYRVMESALAAMDLLEAMAKDGNPASLSDAGVGALAIRACISGALLNVKINGPGLEDKEFVKSLTIKAEAVEKQAIALESKILDLVGSGL